MSAQRKLTGNNACITAFDAGSLPQLAQAAGYGLSVAALCTHDAGRHALASILNK